MVKYMHVQIALELGTLASRLNGIRKFYPFEGGFSLAYTFDCGATMCELVYNEDKRCVLRLDSELPTLESYALKHFAAMNDFDVVEFDSHPDVFLDDDDDEFDDLEDDDDEDYEAGADC